MEERLRYTLGQRVGSFLPQPNAIDDYTPIDQEDFYEYRD